MIALAIGALALRARAFDSNTPPPLAEAAQVILTLPDGRMAPLGALVRPGVPTVISLWASWCGPCRMEAPTIAALHTQAAHGRINLLYLNVRDTGVTREDRNAALTAMQLERDAYAVLPDGSIATLTGDGVTSIPRTLMFDRDGRGVASITGYKPLALARVERLAGL